ncbi:MAG: TetR family transcriptional regulator [Pseudomonadota bacterium]
MPKIVDHDLQREAFAKAAMRLIGRAGLEGVTMRAVAAEAGLSYGSLFHYFGSKDELLLSTVRYALGKQSDRLNDLSQRFSGLDALEKMLCDDALTSESSHDVWMVWMTFQYQAALRDSFAEVNAELVDGWHDRIRLALIDAQEAREVRADLDVDLEASALWAYSTGIGQLGVLHPDAFPVDRQEALVRACINKLRT